ncbi:MAG: SMI1/KNR4 family protein [Schlesneria sp.]
MSEEDVESLLSSHFTRSTDTDPRCAADDAATVVDFFGPELPDEFRSFRRLLPKYDIPGDHLPAQEMILDFEWESANNPNFTTDFVPFYAIGNGDYLCLSRKAGKASPVLYVVHDDPQIATIHLSFAEYLRDPEWFLRCGKGDKSN